MGQEDFYRAPYPVAYTAMKSGLKSPDLRNFDLKVDQEANINLCRDGLELF